MPQDPQIQHYVDVCQPLVAASTEPEATFTELAVPFPFTNMIPDMYWLDPDVTVVYKIGATETRRAVVRREDDILTPQQLQQHWPAVMAAMQKELQDWVNLKNFSRKPRAGARNIVDTRWVHKFKWEQQPVDAVRGSSQSVGTTPSKMIIRSRLTLRGFKDHDRADIDRYAGTSSRCSQKLLVSEAVAQKWDIATTDISKAFLQGVTYEELAKLTGEKAREVNFYLPAPCIPLLRKIEGFEDFDPVNEVLHCDKPGTGLVDAPRAFSLKLGMVTKEECRLEASKVDPELCFRHDNGRLVCLMTKHVDDLKITGEPAVVKFILGRLQHTFGELKFSWKTFNCGVQHVQCPRTKEITLDQIAYARTLNTIAHPQLGTGKPEELAVPEIPTFHVSTWSRGVPQSHTS